MCQISWDLGVSSLLTQQKAAAVVLNSFQHSWLLACNAWYAVDGVCPTPGMWMISCAASNAHVCIWGGPCPLLLLAHKNIYQGVVLMIDVPMHA